MTASGRRSVGTACAAVIAASVMSGCSSDDVGKAREQGSRATRSVASAARSGGARARATMSARASQKADGTPLIQSVAWVPTSGGGSLHVTPTKNGRTKMSVTGNVAWIQVQRLARAEGGQAAAVVDKPGMKAQFVCHWQFARVKEPHKPSWNLEPWRPVVSEKALIDARCNPGGAEGPDQ